MQKLVRKSIVVIEVVGGREECSYLTQTGSLLNSFWKHEFEKFMTASAVAVFDECAGRHENLLRARQDSQD